MEINLDHVDILVRDMDAAKEIYWKLFDKKPFKETDHKGVPEPRQGAFYHFGDCHTTFIAPTPGFDSRLNRLLQRRGEGVHHVCFSVGRHMDEIIRRCQKTGIRLVDELGKPGDLGSHSVYTDPRDTHGVMFQFYVREEAKTSPPVHEKEEIQFNHVVMLGRDMEKAKTFYRDLFEIEPVKETKYEGTPEDRRGAYYKFGDCHTTFMSPTPGTESGLMRQLVRRGEGVHHICFLVGDKMDNLVEKCKKAGIRLVDDYGKPVQPGASSVYTHPKDTFGIVIQFAARDEPFV